MDPRPIYLIMAALIIGDAIAFMIITRQRESLDLQTEAGRKKDQVLKIVMITLPIQAVFVVGVLWAVFRSPLVLPN